MQTDGWILLQDGAELPAVGEWVQVFQDDNDNRQDAFIGKMIGCFQQHVVPGKLKYVDEYGYTEWFDGTTGYGGRLRNVTHWKPLSGAPINKVNGIE